jgi:hypothetical protein
MEGEVCCAELCLGLGACRRLAEVILDAVDTTRRLGFEYLWVDRLCIDQSNPAEKHYLISKTVSIYEGAKLTIVAAARLDAKYGLPGCGDDATPTAAQDSPSAWEHARLYPAGSQSSNPERQVVCSWMDIPRRRPLEQETCLHGSPSLLGVSRHGHPRKHLPSASPRAREIRKAHGELHAIRRLSGQG